MQHLFTNAGKLNDGYNPVKMQSSKKIKIMKTIKITNARTHTNSMSKKSRVIGQTINFSDKFDYECDEYKANEYRQMLDGEYQLYLYSDGRIVLEPKKRMKKSITITEYEYI